MKGPLRLMLHWLPAWCVSATEAASGLDGASVENAFARAREAMVREQLASTERGITDPLVLDAMRQVPRHEFVPPPGRADAYRDVPLPIGYGQTISQPYIVALMTQQLRLRQDDRVLEVGTGSGYQAAVLSQLVAEVYTIEIIEPLAVRASADLKRLGYRNVFVRLGDGYAGWPEAAPFDAVIVACAPDRIPPALVAQLSEDGRLIIPVGAGPDQQLVLVRKRSGQLDHEIILPVRFVPMTRRSDKADIKPSRS